MAQAVVSGGTVTVACKVQNGLRLRIGDFEEETKIIGGAARTYKIWKSHPKQVHIKGPRRRYEVDTAPIQMENGFVLTHGVDADFMAKYMKDNADSDIIQRGLLKVIPKVNDSEAVLRDARDARTGLEPMAQSDDPRQPKKVSRRMDDD